MTTRLRYILRGRPVCGLRIRAEQDGVLVEGVIVHADRFESGSLDCVTVRTDDGREVLVEAGCFGEVVAVMAGRSAA